MMRWLYQLRQYRKENPLAVRLLAYILLFSSVITLTSTATQIYLDYRNDLELIEDRIRQLEATSLNEIASQVWLINDERIRAQLDGLSQLPDLQYLLLDTQFDERFTAGRQPAADTPLLTRRYPLSHTTAEGEEYRLGELTVMFSLERVYRNLKDRVLVIFATQGIKTFLVSIFILYIFWKLVTQHLGTLSRYARALTPHALDEPLVLPRRRQQRDELGEVVSAINTMRESLKEDISQRIQAEQALAELNERLEARVQQRTRELQQANTELSNTLDQLRNTQSQLVESEKMAALGNLVAGVAHEINTPIGIGLTAASYLQDQAVSFRQRQDQHPLVAIAAESSDLITANLKRAAQLINAFKQVSADQSSEQARHFMLGEYLDEILLSMAPRLKQSQPQIEIDCPPDLRLYSYPGALYQILSNLIQNSLIHGFEERPGGTITIRARSDGDTTLIDYRDDGRGINETIRPKVFNPFFTTRRHQGSTGLGLHIAYNLSTQRLSGELRCAANNSDHPRGARFLLRLATRTTPEATATVD
ncbi:sensor histidine kinase [Motiliproteus sediminis]|uniref:sensor histidine kinase n=1 Tax=Motiliproteus sediminis TaxID=1468178 RepID=UPI001FE86AFB|nr:ATP-binding protein [Motiliproteus sediminis]